MMTLGLLVLPPSISSLLQSATSVITKCDSFFYYKVRQLFYYKVRQFYYKVRQVLQSATIITKCDSTGPKLRVHARERAKESLGKD